MARSDLCRTGLNEAGNCLYKKIVVYETIIQK